MTASDSPVLTADGTPLKASLRRALRREKARAFLLVAPLLLFVLLTFIAPIADMLFRSVENGIVHETIPRTVQALQDWDPEQGGPPGDEVYEAFYTDMVFAVERKSHTRLGSRLNYERTGLASLFRKSGRRVGRFDTKDYADAFNTLDPAWEDPATWDALAGSERTSLPRTASAYATWREAVRADGDD
ncbi:MAG: ABC transporter permease, partial [Boseongicola sp.]|nr:ABC transporter permease [Boseongicola sp.]